MMPESVAVKANGARLAVRHYGGAGEPIILLHGGPGMGNYFDSLPEMLSPPYRVIAYDQRGCGASRCDGIFDVDRQVADLDAIRTHFDVQRIHLFGHSWGGLLAQLYAKAHRKHVASLVLCCSMGNTGKNVAMESKGIAERVIGRQRKSVAWLAAGLLLQCPGKLGDVGYGLAIKQLMPKYYVRQELAPRSYDVNRASKRAWRGTNRSIKALDEHYLDGLSIDGPILILQGDQDVIRETNPILAGRFPKAVNVWIKNASHFPWIEEPSQVGQTLKEFYRAAVGIR